MPPNRLESQSLLKKNCESWNRTLDTWLQVEHPFFPQELFLVWKILFQHMFFSLPIVFILSLQMNDSTTNSQSQILLVARDKWNFFVLRRFAACACVGVQVGARGCGCLALQAGACVRGCACERLPYQRRQDEPFVVIKHSHSSFLPVRKSLTTVAV